MQPAAPTADDGCETDTSYSLSHCGSCGHACSNAHVSSLACAAGTCAPTCATSYKNCNNPIAPANNHISVLKGNLAPESCVLKLSGKTLEKGVFRGTARVFDSEADTMKAIRAGDIKPGTVIVVRNVGPVGGPGMPEMVMLTIQLQGRGLGEDVALITDGRFSGVSHGILIGHISPEAARGGPIAAVRDGDTIVIDPKARTLNAELSDAQIAERMKDWKAPDLRARVRPGSVHDKYVRLVSSAHHGCVV